jgi:hypothetical protein
MARKKTNPTKRNTETGEPVAQKPGLCYYLTSFLSNLFVSLYYAAYGVAVLAQYKSTEKLGSGLAAFNQQVLVPNGVQLEKQQLGYVQLTLAYIFIAAPYMAGIAIYKRTVLLLAFLILEWTTFMKGINEV